MDNLQKALLDNFKVEVIGSFPTVYCKLCKHTVGWVELYLSWNLGTIVSRAEGHMINFHLAGEK